MKNIRHDHERYKQMKSSQNIQRLVHTKFTSCSLDFVLKTLVPASDLKMLISFPFFVCLSFLMNAPVVFRMKIKISKSHLSLLISGIICLNLLKNKIWSLASENT
jgi:hypothetical protein